MPKNEEQASMRLISLIEQYELFTNQHGESYISTDVNGMPKIWRLDSNEFKDWLVYQYYTAFGSTANKSSLSDAISVANGKARFQSPEIYTNNRFARNGDSYYLDLAKSDGIKVSINSGGWELKNERSPLFIRTSTMRPLPIPIKGGDIFEFQKFINVPNTDDFILILAYLLECMRPDTPFPILLIDGEQGAAKSTTQKLIKALIDPSSMALRVAPTSVQDIFIAARNDYIVSYNNLSELSPQEQDSLCCLATGGGFAKRKLFTDLDESMADIKRPTILNGIGCIANAADFMDRCVLLHLPIITARARRSELIIEDQFERSHPYLLGALLDLFAKSLAVLPEIELQESPRMSDFASLGAAMCVALGKSESLFLEVYSQNQMKGNQEIIESHPVALGIMCLLNKPNSRSINCNFIQLLDLLKKTVNDCSQLPKNPKGLSSALKRVAPSLRRNGIRVEFDPVRKSDGYRVRIIDERCETKYS